MIDIESLCIANGLPLPITCKALNWNKNTNLYWLHTEYGYKVVSKFHLLPNGYTIEEAKNELNQMQRSYKAPQLHDLIVGISELQGCLVDDVLLRLYYQQKSFNLAETAAKLYLEVFKNKNH